MQKVIYYLETGSTDPFYNLAFEEVILRNRREGDYLLLWQNDNTIVIGQNQNAEAEINRSFVEKHNIKVVRRMTGGGAVYHDLGNLNYSFITDSGDPEKLSMERFTNAVVNALGHFGLTAEASGRNDILVEGRKISGTAQRLMSGRILYHGTLLFDSKPEMVEGALNVDPEKFKSKSSKSVRSRIGNIRSFLQRDMELAEFWQELKRQLSGDLLVTAELTEQEAAEVKKLHDEKYSTWEWNFGRSPKYDMTNKKRFSGGTLEVGAHVEGGKITEIAFYGDFMAMDSLHPLTEALKGCQFKREDMAEVLKRFPLREMFGTITADEILETIFYAGDIA